MRVVFLLLLFVITSWATSLEDILKENKLQILDSFHLSNIYLNTVYWGYDISKSARYHPHVLIQKDPEGHCTLSELGVMDEGWASGGTYSSFYERDGQYYFCVDFGGESERSETATLRLEGEPQVQVIGLHSSFIPYINKANTEAKVSDVWDFEVREFSTTIGSKEYISDIIYAGYKRPLIASVLSPIWGASKITSESDLSGEVQVSWSDSTLTFNVRVKDDKICTGTGIHRDHIELWFSKTPWYSTVRPSEDVQLLINFDSGNMIASYGYPSSRKERKKLKGAFTVKSDEYVAQFEIPVSMLWGRDIEMKEGGHFALSLIVSDADASGRQESMIATSKVKWGKPQTFGRIILLQTMDGPHLKRELFYPLF